MVEVAEVRTRARTGGEASPKLLEIRCRTIEDMRLVNALCRFVELAAIDSTKSTKSTTLARLVEPA